MGDESSIQGLNIIQDDLSPPGETSGSSMNPELEAQLQMWTNLEFPTDDAPFFNPERDTASRSRHKAINPDAVSDPLANSLSFFGNVGAALSSAAAQDHREKSKQLAQAHSINDLFSWGMYNGDGLILNPAGIAVDPFLSSANHVDSLAHDSSYTSALSADGHHPLTIRDASDSRTKSLTLQTVDPSTTSLAPAAKRQKLRKPSSSVDLHSSFDFQISPDLDTDNGSSHGRTQSLQVDESMMDDLQSPTTLGKGEPSHLSAAEDKRRRNTLASARFRLKKKEREVAMEKKAKELDEKVTELERECESLRKENQWLKGLVVGATNGEPMMGSSNPGSTITSPANGLVNPSPANGLLHPSPANGILGGVTNAEAVKGSVIDIDKLIQILQANGAVVTSSSVAAAAAASQASAPPVPASTGKRKRGAASGN